MNELMVVEYTVFAFGVLVIVVSTSIKKNATTFILVCISEGLILPKELVSYPYSHRSIYAGRGDYW